MTTATVVTPDGKQHTGRVTDWLGAGRAEVDCGTYRFTGWVLRPADTYQPQKCEAARTRP